MAGVDSACVVDRSIDRSILFEKKRLFSNNSKIVYRTVRSILRVTTEIEIGGFCYIITIFTHGLTAETQTRKHIGTKQYEHHHHHDGAL
jgi:hypothetical protein